MDFNLQPGTTDDAAAIAALRTAVADHLARQHGRGPWCPRFPKRASYTHYAPRKCSWRGTARKILATLRLATKKPWAIDTSYFTTCRKPLYLHDMAVTPAKQCQGIGRRCLEEAKRIARTWPAEAIRLDAYDAEAGAEPFYAACGYTEVGRVTYRNTSLITNP